MIPLDVMMLRVFLHSVPQMRLSKPPGVWPRRNSLVNWAAPFFNREMVTFCSPASCSASALSSVENMSCQVFVRTWSRP